MAFFLSKFLPLFLLPDGMTCVLLVIVITTVRSRPRLAKISAAGAFGLLLIASNPGVSLLLMGFLETRNVPRGPLPLADAIVVLGGGAQAAQPPRPTIQVPGATANRLLYAVKLYREGKAPIVILCGGSWAKQLPPESELMSQIIETMGVSPSAVVEESSSRNTYENATAVKMILTNRKIHRILLVTSAFHMPRALALFRNLGIETIPAPCDFFTDAPPTFSTYKNWQSGAVASLPSAEALAETTLALREFLGFAVALL